MRPLLFVFAICGAALAAQAPAVFHSGTRLVEIDVVARDAQGFVTGLTKDDFTLWDCKASERSPYMDLAHRLAPCKGKRQAIDVFREVSSASSKSLAKAAPTAPELPPGAVSNRIYAGGELLTNATAVVIDQLNTPFDLKGYERTKVAEFLQSINGQNRIAVYSLGSGLHLLQDFTDDPKKLIDAVSKLDAGDKLNKPASDGGEDSHISELEDQVYKDVKTNATVDAIREIIRHMQGVPGRKSLIWLGQDFSFFDPKFGPPTARGLLGQANISVYPVMVRGLLPSGALEATAATARRKPVMADLDIQFLNRQLGESLGGSGFGDATDALAAFRASEEDATNYYVLGFYLAEADLDDSGHQVTLEISKKVSRRPDLTLKYRHVYLASKSDAPGEDRHPSIGDLFRTPLDASAVGLTAAIVPDPAKPGARQVLATVDLADIELRREQDRWVGSFQVAVRFESMESEVVMATPPVQQTIAVSFTDAELASKRASGWQITEPVPGDVRAGSAHIVVQDGSNGASGSVRVPIEAAAPK
jgi:VWFA-related protein